MINILMGITYIGLIDIIIQMITSGKVQPIQQVLQTLFGG